MKVIKIKNVVKNVTPTLPKNLPNKSEIKEPNKGKKIIKLYI